MAAALPSLRTSTDSTSSKFTLRMSAPTTPSIITNGPCPAERVLVPRSSTSYEAVGSAPLGLTIDKPATLPWSKPMALVKVPTFMSSRPMVATDPVISFFVAVPYPITTTSSRLSLSGSMEMESCLPSTFLSVVLKPMKENSKVWPLSAFIEYLPSISVIVPKPVGPFLMVTVTPDRGSPFSSLTVPLTFCAKTCVAHRFKQKSINKANRCRMEDAFLRNTSIFIRLGL